MLMIAPVQLRTRCLAAFDLDPSKAEPLTFGARSYRRLRVSIRTDDTTTRSTLPSSQEKGIESAMENAQLEALDEELYSEVSQPRHEMDDQLMNIDPKRYSKTYERRSHTQDGDSEDGWTRSDL
jgi:hypothetical protein